MFTVTATEPSILKHRFFISLRGTQLYVCDVRRQMAPEKCHNFPTARLIRDNLNARYN